MDYLIPWEDSYVTLKKLIIPIIFVLTVLYFLLVFFWFFFIVFLPIFYILIAGVYREIIWSSDYFTAKVIGYDDMQSYLWVHIRKPSSTWTKIKMYILWLFLFVPTWECRVRRLSRMYHRRQGD